MDMYILHYRARKCFSIILTLSLVINSFPLICAHNYFITTPGYSELKTKQIQTLFADETKKNNRNKQLFFQRKLPFTIALIIVCGLLIKTYNTLHKINERQDKLHETLTKQDAEIEEITENISPTPSPDMPAGFYDVESKELPSHIRIAAQKVYRATARILIYEEKKGEKELVSSGTGICVTPDGQIMTNYHIIDECISNDNYYIVVEIPTIVNSVRRFRTYTKVKVVKDKCDEEQDIGVLKIDADMPFYFVKPESITPKPGDKIFIIGHPRSTQRCYVSAGEIIKSISSDKSFEFRHNADGRVGSSGSSVFLIDSDGNPRFFSIITKGQTWKPQQVLESSDITVRAYIEAFKIEFAELDIKPPFYVLYQDIINNSNPNIGVHQSFGLATNLSVYLSNAKAFKLFSYTDPNLTPFLNPTFTLTRSLSFTYGKDIEVDRATKQIIAAGPQLVAALHESGISQINITDHSSIDQSIITLRYDTNNPVEEIKRLLDLENKRQKFSQYCQQYGFSVYFDEEYANIDKIDDIFKQIKKHAQSIGAALKEIEIQEIEITNINSTSGSELMINSDNSDIIKKIMQIVEFEKLNKRLNEDLTSYGFDVDMIYFGVHNISQAKAILNNIQDYAKPISELLNNKKILHIIISNHNRITDDKVYIDYRSNNPFGSIKDAFIKKQDEKPVSSIPDADDIQLSL